MPPRTVGPLLALLAASQFLPAAEPVVSSAPATPAPLERADPRLVPTPRARALPASATHRPVLAALGYTETEYIVRGFASIYDWVGAPHEAAVGVKAAGIPYATRILVRRPRDAARASGRVVVELLNPTGLYDFAPLWGFSWQHFTRSGDVWVGVTVKPVAAATLKRYDPVRYADIS